MGNNNSACCANNESDEMFTSQHKPIMRAKEGNKTRLRSFGGAGPQSEFSNNSFMSK